MKDIYKYEENKEKAYNAFNDLPFETREIAIRSEIAGQINLLKVQKIRLKEMHDKEQKRIDDHINNLAESLFRRSRKPLDSSNGEGNSKGVYT